MAPAGWGRCIARCLPLARRNEGGHTTFSVEHPHACLGASIPLNDRLTRIRRQWRADGRELYYLGLDGAVMATDVEPGPDARLGIPRVLFRTGVAVNILVDQYDASSDGQRFLVLEPAGARAQAPVSVIANWPSTLTP